MRYFDLNPYRISKWNNTSITLELFPKASCNHIQLQGKKKVRFVLKTKSARGSPFKSAQYPIIRWMLRYKSGEHGKDNLKHEAVIASDPPFYWAEAFITFSKAWSVDGRSYKAFSFPISLSFSIIGWTRNSCKIHFDASVSFCMQSSSVRMRIKGSRYSFALFQL